MHLIFSTNPMDLSQTKLTKTEWKNTEIPVSLEEKSILELICAGFNNPEIRSNPNMSLFTFTKIERTPITEQYLYEYYFQALITPISSRLFAPEGASITTGLLISEIFRRMVKFTCLSFSCAASSEGNNRNRYSAMAGKPLSSVHNVTKIFF